MLEMFVKRLTLQTHALRFWEEEVDRERVGGGHDSEAYVVAPADCLDRTGSDLCLWDVERS